MQMVNVYFRPLNRLCELEIALCVRASHGLEVLLTCRVLMWLREAQCYYFLKNDAKEKVILRSALENLSLSGSILICCFLRLFLCPIFCWMLFLHISEYIT